MPVKTPDYKTELREKKQEIQLQLDRIYRLLEKKSPVPVIEFEYLRAVDRISEQYALFLAALEQKKSDFTPEEFEKQVEALRASYKDDLVDLAVTIERTMEAAKTPETA